MSEVGKRILAEAVERYGRPPESFVFGDGIDWDSPLDDLLLHVELPFWLMMPEGSVEVEWSGAGFTVHIYQHWMEVFVDDVTDSRRSVIHYGPWRPTYEPPRSLPEELREGHQWMRRRAKTVLGIPARAHNGAFKALGEEHPPRARAEQDAYLASLCEAHIPVVNEVIERYRLASYDFFPYEVSAWDVPVWWLRFHGHGYRAALVPYKEWDVKPATIEDGDAADAAPNVQPFQFATIDQINALSSSDATPGEFDLLDARSRMERGDYTGAVRRSVTAIEAVLEWSLLRQFERTQSSADAVSALDKTRNDFPGRFRQWIRLSGADLPSTLVRESEATRAVRHEIVHQGRRLTHDDRGRAQRSVDTTRWLFNKIEQRPERTELREREIALRSVGRAALAPRFPVVVVKEGLVVRSFRSQLDRPTQPDASG